MNLTWILRLQETLKHILHSLNIDCILDDVTLLLTVLDITMWWHRKTSYSSLIWSEAFMSETWVTVWK